MSPDILHSGWNATDDGESVPVRSAATPERQSATAIDNVRMHADAGTTDPRMMQLSALAGIGAVLLCSAFYFGFFTIQGTLFTGALTETADGTTVTITSAGAFEPTAVTTRPGESITFKNANPDPQVLKAKDGKELFPVQVLFSDPYSVTVPMNASGTYTYFSETLPEDEMLSITVVPSATSSSMSSVEPQDAQIPIPFADVPAVTPEAVVMPIGTSSSASSSSAPTVEINAENEGMVITLGRMGSSSSSPTFDQRKIPTNPYTVAAGAQSSASKEIMKNAAQGGIFHSGAPLQAIRQHTPTSVTQTGPADTGAILVVAFALFILVYRRVIGTSGI